MTKLEILNETVAFYSADVTRRSVIIGGDCAYNGDNGTHCAVGRCLLPKYHEMGDKLPENHWTINALVIENECQSLDEMLQEQYRGHEVEFWRHLQILHDTVECWDASGITTFGELRTNDILEMFQSN